MKGHRNHGSNETTSIAKLEHQTAADSLLIKGTEGLANKRGERLTLVERHSRFTMLVKVARRDSATVVAALAQTIGTLPEELRRSLTWDQGKEMARHKSFTVATDLQVYFCDPRSPWQRGSNENTNGLLRQYFPRDTNSPMSRRPNSTPSPCGSISDPRKTLDFETPAYRLQKVLR